MIPVAAVPKKGLAAGDMAVVETVYLRRTCHLVQLLGHTKSISCFTDRPVPNFDLGGRQKIYIMNSKVTHY